MQPARLLASPTSRPELMQKKSLIHPGDRIKAVFGAQRPAELDAGNLGDGVPLIGGLQLTR